MLFLQMLMSANEPGINLHSDNNLGPDLPSCQVVIGRRDDLEATSNKICITKTDARNRNINIGPLRRQKINEAELLPQLKSYCGNSFCNNLNEYRKTTEALNTTAGLKNNNESRSLPSNINTNNLCNQQQECTTYVISNTSSCTLRVKSAGFGELGNKKNKVSNIYIYIYIYI